MKTTLKLLITILLCGWFSLGYAQTYEWQKPQQTNETKVGDLLIKVDGGKKDYYTDGRLYVNTYREYSDETLYRRILDTANARYASSYPNFSLRNFKSNHKMTKYYSSGDVYEYDYYVSAIVVIPEVTIAPKPVENPLSRALDKALLEVREGSKIAIDQIRVPTGTDKGDYKDEVVEALLEKGFKVVAKEYLERLYEEQQNQGSGIYNDKTTVQENNFSAVGYYLNVKLTETALRVQVINVSTGEYEGNVTIKLQQ